MHDTSVEHAVSMSRGRLVPSAGSSALGDRRLFLTFVEYLGRPSKMHGTASSFSFGSFRGRRTVLPSIRNTSWRRMSVPTKCLSQMREFLENRKSVVRAARVMASFHFSRSAPSSGNLKLDARTGQDLYPVLQAGTEHL